MKDSPLLKIIIHKKVKVLYQTLIKKIWTMIRSKYFILDLHKHLVENE